jgi:hypothetical protein
MTTAKRNIINSLIKQGGRGIPMTLSYVLIEELVRDGIIQKASMGQGNEYEIVKDCDYYEES